MFKLESYIAPLLMGYIDKYVKLKHEDFQLSLWGGDAVLTKLDLRLDAIEKTLKLPITFKSGLIHELRIHVPWTKLGSEPVVITINTIECILKLRDSGHESDAASSSTAGSSKPPANQQLRPKVKRQEAEDLPPGYLQSLINKITNNVNIVINNLILKFVEDDIVLSVNVKSAECYSVNHEWKRSFIELSMPELVLRRVINFHDLTVCLDKRNADGKIENYQDPILYRCSLTCRMHMIYDSLNAKFASVTRFNLLCEKLDLSLTDIQVPMFFRLVELCVAIYYGTLELPGSTSGSKSDSYSDAKSELDLPEPSAQVMHSDDQDDQGWASWAWSYVPQILPANDEDDLVDERTGKRRKPEPAVLSIGFYVTKSTVMFKLTETIQDSPFGPSKSSFNPCMTWEADGISLEILMRGLTFFNVQFGMTNSTIFCQGESISGIKDLENTGRDPAFLKSGMALEEKSSLLYQTNSLFDPGGAENQAEKPQYVFDQQKYMERFTEGYALQKFGVVFLDYLYTAEKPVQDTQSGSGSQSSAETLPEENMRENSSIRVIFGPLHLTVSGSATQRLQKFFYCLNNHEYEPYSQPHKERVDETRPPPSDDDVRAMEEFVPTRSYHLAFLRPTCWIKANDLPHGDVTKKKVISHRKHNKRKLQSSTDPQGGSRMQTLPMLVLNAERIDFQLTSAMYARHLVQNVSKMVAPSGNLMHHCHSHMYIKVFSVQAGLSQMDGESRVAPVQICMKPFSAAYYCRKLLLNMYWNNTLQPQQEVIMEMPQFGIAMTMPQVFMMMHLVNSWMENTPTPSRLLELSILDDVFRSIDSQGHRKYPLLELSMSGLMVKECKAAAVRSLNASLTSLQTLIYSVEGSKDQITPLLYGPLDTTRIPTQDYFQDSGPLVGRSLPDCVTLTFQVPLDADMPAAPSAILLDLQGIVGCVDPLLYDWLTYSPRTTAGISVPCSQSVATPTVLDPALAQSTSPLQHKDASQGSQSGSTVTGPTGTQTRSRSQTQTQSRSHLQASRQDTSLEDASQQQKQPEEKTWGKILSKIYPLVKIMEVQVDIQNSCAFLLTRHVTLSEPTLDIPQNLLAVYTSGKLPATLVLCCPLVKVYSAGHKTISPLQEIPIKALEHSVAGEKLPWSVQLSNCSIYSIHKSSSLLHLLQPLSLSATVSVTTKYQSPTSDDIISLGLVIHSDVKNTMALCLSQPQVQLIYELASKGLYVGKKVISNVNHQMALIGKSQSTTAQTSDTLKPLQPVGGSSPKPIPRNASSSGQWEPPEVVVTATETSETASRGATPVKELETASSVSLSLWLQWTLPKFLLKLYSCDNSDNEICLRMEIEDLWTSMDIKKVVSKVTCKVGAVDIGHQWRESDEREWLPGQLEGILLSSSEHLTHNVQLMTNKVWTSKGQPATNAFTSQDMKPQDKAHFLNLTYFRALKSNVKKRMRKMNGEEDEKELREEEKGYLSEVNLNIQPYDVVVNCPVITNVMKIFTVKPLPLTAEARLQRMQEPKQADDSQLSCTGQQCMPWLHSGLLPLVNISATNTRIFIPVYPNAKTDGVQEKLGYGMPDSGAMRSANQPQQNVIVLQMLSLILSSEADNPLPRIVVEKDFYRRAVHSGATRQRGSDLEDRQYQLDVSGLSLSTGVWSDLIIPQQRSRQEDEISVQHPALEWNNLAKTETEKEEAKLIPMASGFDMRVVGAPAIVHTPSPGDVVDYKHPVLICGHSLEINATSDMDFFLSTSQVKLMLNIYDTNISSALQMVSHRTSGKSKPPHSMKREDSFLNDSGVESETSTFVTLMPKQESSGVLPPKSLTESSDNMSQEYQCTPFDILLTAGKISFMVYSHCKESNKKSSEKVPTKRSKNRSDLDLRGEAQSTISSLDSGLESIAENVASSADSSISYQTRIVPFLYAQFSQPHSLLSCQPSTQKVELSCYDIILKGPKPDYVTGDDSKVIPDTSDFAIHWIETLPGHTDPKTGIPPSLYTLRVTDFLIDAAEVKLNIERPLKLNLSSSKMQQVMSFIKELQCHLQPILSRSIHNTDTSAVHKASAVQQDRPPDYLRTLAFLTSVQLFTMQVLVAMETDSNPGGAAAQLSVSGMDGKITFLQDEPGNVDEFHTNLCIKDALIKTCYANKWRPLVGPFTTNLLVECVWGKHSGLQSLPRVMCFVDIGMVTVHLGQEHFLCFDALVKPYEQYAKKEDGEKGVVPKTPSPQKSRVPSGHSKTSPPRPGSKLDYDHSCDDLRAGGFEYITEDAGMENLPQVGEILFNLDYRDGHAAMSWCYPDPRVVTSVCITPVPFNTAQWMHARYIDETLKVPCVLQYWDVLSRSYEDYANFAVSENESCEVPLPEVTGDYNPDHKAASVWRVHILHPRDKADRDEDESEVKSLEPLVSPLTLAASIRVDSCFIPSIIPVIQCCFDAGLIQIRLANHMCHLGKGTPEKLHPFILDGSSFGDEEFLIVSIESPTMRLSHIQGQYQRLHLQVNGSVGVDVMEYRNLTLQPMLDPWVLSANLSWIHHPQFPRVKIHMYSEPFYLRVGAGMVHTLNGAAEAWQQVSDSGQGDKEKRPAVVLHCYLICNDTQENIRIRQALTDESIVMKRRACHPYSWRTTKAKQVLQLSVEGMGGTWCEAVDIDIEGSTVRIVEHKGHTATLVIRTKQISGMQKQVSISGQIIISSRLSQHLEVKLVTSKPSREVTSLLGARQTLPSYVMEHGSVRALKVRHLGVNTPWSQEIIITGEKMKDTRLVKIPLHDKVNYMHIWCHIFVQDYTSASQNLVIFLPLFMVQSQLGTPIYMNIETPRLKNSQQVAVKGHGEEEQLHHMAGDMTHSITFQLSTVQLASKPAFSLSSGMIEQVERHPVGKVEIEALAYDWEGQDTQPWPYNQYEDIRVFKDNPSKLMTPEDVSFPGPLLSKENPQQPSGPSLSPPLDPSVPALTLHLPPSGPALVPPLQPSAPTLGPQPPAPQPPALALTPPHPSMPAPAPHPHLLPPRKAAVDQPRVDLQISFSERWPGCNSIVIQVAPHWLMVNDTDLDFVVVESNETEWSLPRHESFAPPHFEGSFRLGVMSGNQLHLSDNLTLSEEETTYRYQADLDTVIYKKGHIKVNVPISEGSMVTKVCYFVIHSTISEKMQIVTVRERYILANHTPWNLSMQAFSLPLSQSKVELNYDELLPTVIDSNTLSPLPIWNVPSVKENRNDLDLNCVQYVTFTHKSQYQNQGQDKVGHGEMNKKWSVPHRIRTVEGGSRGNISVPSADGDGQMREFYCTDPCVLTTQEKNGIVYIVVDQEDHPPIEIHNNCPFGLYFGQALAGVVMENVTVQEEAELLYHVPYLPPGGSAHYALPAYNIRFPDISLMTDTPKMHLAGCHSNDLKNPKLLWSGGVDLSTEHDIFVHIPELSDTKVHVEKVGHIVHVFVDPVNRAEISAKEIRSRIKGKETTTFVEGHPKKEKSPPKESPPKETLLRQKSVKTSPRTLYECTLICKEVCFVILDEFSSLTVIHEMLRTTGDNLCLYAFPNIEKTLDHMKNYQPHVTYTVMISAFDLQIDNQMFKRGVFDFPVILLRQNPCNVEGALSEDFLDLPESEKVLVLRKRSTILVDIGMCIDLVKNQLTLQGVNLAVQPLSLYLEDVFIYDCLKRIDKFIPTKLSVEKRQSSPKKILPKEVRLSHISLSQPIRVENLQIQPMTMLLSVHASLKLFIASDNTPLRFGLFERKKLFTSRQQLIRGILVHYASGTLFRAGWVVGSLEILGNPTGLVRSFSTGISDFFCMPYEGLTKGPGAFLAGVTRGAGSLLKHISTGTLMSITNFASSVARNMERLSLDEDHRERQEETRRNKPAGLSQGLKQGLTGLGLSVLGAVAGIADQPIQSIAQAASPDPSTSNTRRATGIVFGVGKGLVGAVTKPIGGAAEFVSQTGMGLLHGVGLTSFPNQRETAGEIQNDQAAGGDLKYLQKLLPTVPDAEILMTVDYARQVDSRGGQGRRVLLLTSDILFLVSVAEDAQLQAFAVSEIECRGSQSNSSLLYVVLREFTPECINWNEEKIDNKDRVAAFIDGTANFASMFANETIPESQSETSSLMSGPLGSKKFEFEVSPMLREQFLSLFALAKAKATGIGFPI